MSSTITTISPQANLAETIAKGDTSTTIIALALAIVGLISNFFLHYRLKHFKVACIESDCIEKKSRSGINTPTEASAPPPAVGQFLLEAITELLHTPKMERRLAEENIDV